MDRQTETERLSGRHRYRYETDGQRDGKRVRRTTGQTGRETDRQTE